MTGRSTKYDVTRRHRARWGRASSRDCAGLPTEPQQKGKETWRSAKYEAAYGQKGEEGTSMAIMLSQV